MPRKWSKISQAALAEHVTRDARKLLSPELNVLDLLREEDGKVKIAERVYNALLERKLQYALEPGATARHRLTQEIRTPSEVLESLKEGTCLDLALLFCGVCLGCELLPVLIMFEDHAVVAVSRNYGLYDWDRRGRDEDALFKDALVREDRFKDIYKLVVEEEAYVAIECTGVACSQSLDGDTPECVGRGLGGTFDFKRAIEAGTQQFDPLYGRKFKFALDMAVAHLFHEIAPAMIGDETITRGSNQSRQGLKKRSEADPLPYLLDRSEQEKALRKAVLYHRAGAHNRPLVCVIHGNEYECHTEFIIRLQEISLPKILSYWHPAETVQTSIIRYRVELSPSDLAGPDWEDIMWEELVAAVARNPEAPHDLVTSPQSREGVVDFISRHKLAVVIDIPLLTEKLEGASWEHINLLFEFWNKWGVLSDELLLVVCLSFKYQSSYEAKRSWYQMLARSRTLNDRVREYVESLDFERYGNLYGVRLPELRGILQSDAEEAVSHLAVSQRGYTDRHVRRIYERAGLHKPGGRIPMDTLLIKFDEVLGERST